VAEVRVNGVRLAYELLGQGEPILLLAGTGMAKEVWLAGPASALAEAGYQVVLIDNRGVGASDSPPAPYAVADLAADAAGLIEQLGVGPCRLVGYSLGGYAAEVLAAERPELLRAVALLASAGPLSACARFGLEAEAETARQGIDLPRGKQVFDALATCLTPAQLQDDAVVRRFTEKMLTGPQWGNPGRHGQFAAGAAWSAQDIAAHSARWAKISVPVLAVAFEHDVLCPPASARQLSQAVSGAELALIPGSGHYAVITHAGEVATVLLNFFATN
jgi:pimeloyl-ACP methyl ester carboxylesterase